MKGISKTHFFARCCLLLSVGIFSMGATFNLYASSYEALIKKYSESKDKAFYNKEIWETFGYKKTVYISDMSGFTRITKEEGIVHFLALVYVNQEMSSQIIKKNHGQIVKYDADNIYAVFDNPEHAINSAIEVEQYFAKYNAGKKRNDKVQLSIGISAGKILLFDHDLYGDAVNVASKLGEDTATAQQILVDEKILYQNKLNRSYSNTKMSTEISGVKLDFSVINWQKDSSAMSVKQK